MRAENAVYGGEMSAHHYFRDFSYCDSGMIPWLLIAELISRTGQSLADWVDARMLKYPCSGEINYKVDSVSDAIARVMANFAPFANHLDYTDGVSVEFEEWRFNLRGSNTEPLLRLNVESRTNKDFIDQRVKEIESLIRVDSECSNDTAAPNLRSME